MDVEPAFAAAHEDLIYELENLEFVEVEPDIWSGTIGTDVGDRSVRIEFHAAYPGRPPHVWVADMPLTWHQEHDGRLCLWSQTSPGHFPWLQRGALVAKIKDWVEAADANWAGADVDLDLERYWKPSHRFELLVLPNVDRLGPWVRLAHETSQNLLKFESIMVRPRQGTRGGRYKYALIVDIMEPALPPREWGDIEARLVDGRGVLEAMTSHRADVLVVRYTLAGKRGAFGLEYVGGKPGNPKFQSVTIAQDGDDYRQLRSGHLAATLKDKTVAIVGLGSVGSFVADALARAGVGDFILVDYSRLRPGHLPRYAFDGPLGWRKVDAVAMALQSRGATTRAVRDFFTHLEPARTLVDAADCVIDATGNEVVTALLGSAATESGKKFVCTYLANDGQDLVAEILPTADGTAYLPPDDRSRLAPDGYESGCGDAVSPTAPYAVQEAALMATRAAISLLCPSLDPPAHPARDYSW